MRDLAIALSGLNVFVSPVVVVGLALRTVQEHWSAAGLGLLTGVIGAGAVVGTLAVLRRQPARPVLFALPLLLAQAVALGPAGGVPFAALLALMPTVGVTAGMASPLTVGACQQTSGRGTWGGPLDPQRRRRGPHAAGAGRLRRAGRRRRAERDVPVLGSRLRAAAQLRAVAPHMVRTNEALAKGAP